LRDAAAVAPAIYRAGDRGHVAFVERIDGKQNT